MPRSAHFTANIKEFSQGRDTFENVDITAKESMILQKIFFPSLWVLDSFSFQPYFHGIIDMIQAVHGLKCDKTFVQTSPFHWLFHILWNIIHLQLDKLCTVMEVVAWEHLYSSQCLCQSSVSLQSPVPSLGHHYTVTQSVRYSPCQSKHFLSTPSTSNVISVSCDPQILLLPVSMMVLPGRHRKLVSQPPEVAFW